MLAKCSLCLGRLTADLDGPANPKVLFLVSVRLDGEIVGEETLVAEPVQQQVEKADMALPVWVGNQNVNVATGGPLPSVRATTSHLEVGGGGLQL